MEASILYDYELSVCRGGFRERRQQNRGEPLTTFAGSLKGIPAARDHRAVAFNQGLNHTR